MWADKYGMIHVEQDETSENGVLFTLEYYLLRKLRQEDNPYWRSLWDKIIEAHEVKREVSIGGVSAIEYIPGAYKQTPWGVGRDRASHDNMTAIMVASVIFGLYYHTHARVIGEYWHPRDILFYQYLKTSSKLLKWVYLPFPCLDMIRTCLRVHKRRNGRKMIATDGKLLAWVRFQVQQKKPHPLLAWTEKLCTKIINKRLGGWDKVFNIYFKNPTHPNRRLAHEIYEEAL